MDLAVFDQAQGRYCIVRAEHAIVQIAEKFHLSKPTLSHHFRVLRAAGLVRAERRGTSIVYTLQSNVLEDLAAELLDLIPSNARLQRRKS